MMPLQRLGAGRTWFERRLRVYHLRRCIGHSGILDCPLVEDSGVGAGEPELAVAPHCLQRPIDVLTQVCRLSDAPASKGATFVS